MTKIVFRLIAKLKIFLGVLETKLHLGLKFEIWFTDFLERPGAGGGFISFLIEGHLAQL